MEPVKIRYHQGETGWAIPQDDGTCVVDNLPFDGGLLQLGDRVSVRMPRSAKRSVLPFATRVEERCYHAWSRVHYAPYDQDTYTALRKAAEAGGAVTEGLGSIPSGEGALVLASNTEDEIELTSILSKASDVRLTGSKVGPGFRFQIVFHKTLPPAPFDLSDLDPDFGAPAPRNL